MKIVLINSKGQNMILPVLPENMPELIQNFKNTIFESITGDINIMGSNELRKVTLESFFPNKNYNFITKGSKDDAWLYVSFINEITKNKETIRMIWLDQKEEEISNMLYSIDSFKTQIDKACDIQYTLEMTEFISY